LVNRGPEVVVITGASAGVGRAAARKLARHGARIGLVARGNDGLKAARREVEELGSEALIVPTDVANADQVEAAAAQIEAEFGRIDIWINNAMTSVFSPIKEMTAEKFRRVTEVTYLGYVYGTLAALKRMLPRDGGVIVQVGSTLAYRAIPLQSAYCAAKHAVQGFCDSLRCELLHDQSGVCLTMVQLLALNTPQFGWVKSRLPRKARPVPPIFQPEVAAEAIYFASHNPRREFYIGEPSVGVIVANKFVPGLLDHYLAGSGYDSQQCDGAEDPNRPDNLWQAVPGDQGAHGAFDARAHSWSTQWWTNERRGLIATAVVALAFAGLLAVLKDR